MMGRIRRLWHAYRAGYYQQLVERYRTRVALLRKAERQYGDSYYTDKLIAAEEDLAVLELKLEAHMAMILFPVNHHDAAPTPNTPTKPT